MEKVDVVVVVTSWLAVRSRRHRLQLLTSSSSLRKPLTVPVRFAAAFVAVVVATNSSLLSEGQAETFACRCCWLSISSPSHEAKVLVASSVVSVCGRIVSSSSSTQTFEREAMDDAVEAVVVLTVLINAPLHVFDDDDEFDGPGGANEHCWRSPFSQALPIH